MKLHTALATILLAAAALPAAAQQTSVLPPDKAAEETAKFLKDLVQIDTQDPPGNESKVAAYIAAVLKRENIAYEILEPVPGRASIVARLKGDGTRKPVLMLAHEDVVPVDRAHWSFDPFAADVKNGTLYGRGASDDKSPLAAHLETLLQLHRSGQQFSRDIIFLAEASEEAGSEAGMNTIVNRYWDKIACEFAMNEGGAAEVSHDDQIAYFGIATGEKLPRGVKLVSHGSSGHGSVPVLDNPITHLAQAVARLGTWETPTRPNETTREFFARLATISPPDQAVWFKKIDAPETQAYLHQNMPQFYSMLHTTVVPTVLKGGFKINVIPPEAEAEIDIRALPDENIQAFYAQMNKIVDDPSVKIEPDMSESMPPAPESSIHTAMFAALEAAQKKLLPKAITVPMMTTGATDSAFLRAKGVNAYGIRVPRTFEENTGVHGNDERIELKYVALYQQLVEEAVKAVSK